jgi:hypothetical protein
MTPSPGRVTPLAMKQGVLLGIAVAVATGGYYGYGYLQDQKAKKKAAAEDKAALKEKLDHDQAVRANTSNRKVTTVPMIDLAGMTPDVARKALDELGFKIEKFKVLEGYSCQYPNEKLMKPKGTICSQDPSAGTLTATSHKVEVTIEEDDFEAGGIGGVSEWKRMPDLLGMTREAAVSKLKEVGFRDDEFAIDERQGCEIGIVCGTSPDPGQRKVRARSGTVTIGH